MRTEYSGTTVSSGAHDIPKRISSNPGHGSRGGWASTRGNSSQMGGLSDTRSLLGSLLQPTNSRKMSTLSILIEAFRWKWIVLFSFVYCVSLFSLVACQLKQIMLENKTQIYSGQTKVEWTTANTNLLNKQGRIFEYWKKPLQVQQEHNREGFDDLHGKVLSNLWTEIGLLIEDGRWTVIELLTEDGH